MIKTNKKLESQYETGHWVDIHDQIPEVTEEVGNVGIIPAHVLDGLSPEEKKAAWVMAGKNQFDKALDSKTQPYTWVPYYPNEAQQNIFLCIRRIESNSPRCIPQEKTWRIFDVAKTHCLFHEFHRLENAQNVFWDIIRSILVWGKPERKRELKEMMMTIILKHKK